MFLYGCGPSSLLSFHLYSAVSVQTNGSAFALTILAALTTLGLLQHRRQAFSVQSESSFSKGTFGGISTGQFVRLLALASVDSFFTLPLSIATIIINATTSPIFPWLGLANTHFNFSRVDQFPAVLWRLNGATTAALTCDHVFILLCAFIFASFFSFANETRKWWYEHLFKPLGKRFNLPFARERWGTNDNSFPMAKLKGASGLLVSVDVAVKRDTFRFGLNRQAPQKSPSFGLNDDNSSFWEDEEDLKKSIGAKFLPSIPRVSDSPV